MSPGDLILTLAGVVVMLVFASLLWAQLDRLTGLNRIPWYRRVFWRRTVGDLLAELQAGGRSEISSQEIALAKAYERRRRPKGLRYPRAGEIYESVGDVEVRYLTAHIAPFTGGGRAILPKGERVRVAETDDPEPSSVYCDPINYDALHERLVSAAARDQERYQGYFLCIDTVDLNRHFRFIDGATSDGENTQHAG